MYKMSIASDSSESLHFSEVCMKKIILALVIALTCVASSFAGEVFAKNGMLMAPGDKAVSIGFQFPVGAIGSYEMVLGKFEVAELPLSYGVKALGGASFWGDGMRWEAGAVGTLHFSWACIDLPENLWWIQNFDTFVGLGFGVVGWNYKQELVDLGWKNQMFPGLWYSGGSTYHFKENLAITFAGGNASFIGLLIKL